MNQHIKSLWKFGRHISEAVEARLEAVGAGRLPSDDAKVALETGEYIKSQLSVSVREVQHREPYVLVVVFLSADDLADVIHEFIDVGHLVFVFVDILVKFPGIQCQFDRFITFDCDDDGTDELVVSAGVELLDVAFFEEAIDFLFDLGLDGEGNAPFWCVGVKLSTNLVFTTWWLVRPMRVKRWGYRDENRDLAPVSEEIVSNNGEFLPWELSPFPWVMFLTPPGGGRGCLKRASPYR